MGDASTADVTTEEARTHEACLRAVASLTDVSDAFRAAVSTVAVRATSRPGVPLRVSRIAQLRRLGVGFAPSGDGWQSTDPEDVVVALHLPGGEPGPELRVTSGRLRSGPRSDRTEHRFSTNGELAEAVDAIVGAWWGA